LNNVSKVSFSFIFFKNFLHLLWCFRKVHLMRSLFAFFVLGSALSLTGCTAVSAVSAAANIANFALESTGLKKPDLPELPEFQKPPRNVALKLHAGSNLNAGTTGKPLSLITRVYKLKQTAAFYSAPYDTFLSPEKEKALLGADLIEVRELSLIPGQLYEVNEKVSRESAYIGVVTLFRVPAPQRWRAAFIAAEAETSGITMGLHACSLTIGKGASTDQVHIAQASNIPSRCQ
jgi:type VI secretion system protein VasD